MRKLNHIADLLGQKFLLINIVLLILALFIICSFIKNRVLRFILSFGFSVFTTLQISSLFFVRKFIGYSFIIHFNKRDVKGMLDLFTYEILLFFISILLFSIFYFYSKRIIDFFINYIKSKLSFTKKILTKTGLRFYKICIIILAFFTMSLSNGVLDVSYNLLKSLQVDDNSFNENLKKLGINDYVSPNELIASSKEKNIIVISLESFEKGFLNTKYSHLTPYLRSLKINPDWTFINMNENEGSIWTSGSLYTYLTGFPAFFGTFHNGIFQSSYHSNITGISHVLNKAGYQTTHLSANARISGTDDMLYALKIDNIIDKTQLKEKTQDKDIFNKAKQIVLENTSQKKPFALFIATLSTHFPDGIYDKRMEQYITPKNSDLEFMISAVDFMLKDFISYLEANNLLSNTLIYIFPDHLKMGSNELLNETGKRGLYVLTNASKNLVKKSINDTIYQVDLPNIILDGAEITHNAKFLADYIEGDKNEFIKKNISELTSLNVSGFLRTELEPYLIPEASSNYEIYKKDVNRFIAHAGGIIDNHIYTNSLEALNKSYQQGFKLFELDIQKTSDGKYVAAHSWNDWQEMTNYKGKVPVSQQEFLKHKIYNKYTPLDIETINKWFKEHDDAILVTDKINEPKLFSDLFIDKSRLMMELFTWEAVLKGINANIKSAMPSQKVIYNLNGNLVKKLVEHNITDVAVSRNSIASKIDLLKALKRNNINVYVYNVNERIDRGEDYVVKYEMDIVYGLYADKWNFIKQKNSNK